MNNVSLDTLESCEIEITSSTGKTVPIKDQVLSLSIFEDIFEPLMTCEVTINDAIGLAHDLPIIGEEVLTVIIKSTNAKKESKYQFALTNAGDVLNDDNNRYQTYMLTGTSLEAINNSKISVQKGYKDSYENIIKDICKTFLGSKKTVYTTPMKGVHQIIVPNLPPLTAIDFARQRSVSNNNDYSPVVFFENTSGFVFSDIVTLFKTGKSKDRDSITRYYRPSNTSDHNESTNNAWKDMIAYQLISKHDTLAKTENGAFYSNLNRFDLFKKQFAEVETKMSDIVNKFDLVEKGKPNTPELTKALSSKGATNYMVYVDGARSDTHIDLFGQRVTFSSLLFQTMAEAEFHGDTTLTVGDVLYISLTKPTGITEDEPDQEDTKQSGYHLITKVAHHITFAGEPSLRTSCEFVKGANKDIKGRL